MKKEQQNQKKPEGPNKAQRKAMQAGFRCNANLPTAELRSSQISFNKFSKAINDSGK
jgi:hypothetical protein